MRNKFNTPTGCQVEELPDTGRVDPVGAQLLQDVWLMGTPRTTDSEQQAGRQTLAGGAGAYGTFTVTHDISRYTRAKLFSRLGKKTDLFARFSTEAGACDAPAAQRTVRGFAVRFYTEDGNWDMVGYNTPVCFVRDPLQVPELTRALQSEPATAGGGWDFLTTRPEALHQITMLMSDRGIPASYRHMHGFARHTFSFINAHNERHWVKFHFKTRQGVRNLSDAQAEMRRSRRSEALRKDLFNAIEDGNFPQWTLMVQVMPHNDVVTLTYNPFDPTKVWPHQDYPLLVVGILELNRNPADCFAEVDPSAFHPAHRIPGIGHSPDRMLQWRLASAIEAQCHRPGDAASDWEESDDVEAAAGDDPTAVGATALAPSMTAAPWDTRVDSDCYAQPGALFRQMTPAQQQFLCENTARALSHARRDAQLRHIHHCTAADPAYGAGVARALSQTSSRPNA